MNGMMNDMGAMMAGMGLIWLVLLVVLVLVGAAAIKYLFFERRRRPDRNQ